MSFARLSLSLAAVIGIIATALAGATIWLLITQPVTVADAVASGEVGVTSAGVGAGSAGLSALGGRAAPGNGRGRGTPPPVAQAPAHIAAIRTAAAFSTPDLSA